MTTSNPAPNPAPHKTYTKLFNWGRTNLYELGCEIALVILSFYYMCYYGGYHKVYIFWLCKYVCIFTVFIRIILATTAARVLYSFFSNDKYVCMYL